MARNLQNEKEAFAHSAFVKTYFRSIHLKYPASGPRYKDNQFWDPAEVYDYMDAAGDIPDDQTMMEVPDWSGTKRVKGKMIQVSTKKFRRARANVAIRLSLMARSADIDKESLNRADIHEKGAEGEDPKLVIQLRHTKELRMARAGPQVTAPMLIKTQKGASKNSDTVAVVKDYMKHTRREATVYRQMNRKSAPLFLQLNKQGKNRLGKFWDGLASDTIANDSIWFLKLAGIDTSIFKAHSVRGAAASKALRAGAPMVDIMSRARWSNERTFRKHYGGAIAEAALKSDLEEALRSKKFKQKKRKNKASKPKLPKPKKQKTKKTKSRKSGIRPTGQRLVGSRCNAWFPYLDGIGMWQGEVTKFDSVTRKYDFLFEDGETIKWNAADVSRMERARPAQLEWCASNAWMK